MPKSNNSFTGSSVDLSTLLSSNIPDIILDVVAINPTSSTVDVSWTAPNSNGSVIVDYSVQYKKSTDTAWTVAPTPVSTSTSATVVGLDGNTDYDFRVRTVSDNGASPYGNVATISTTLDLPFFQPGAFYAMNTGGAGNCSVVSLDDTNEIKLNGLTIATLNRAQTFAFSSTQYDVLEASGAFFVAGNLLNSNVVWSKPTWAGKSFLVSAIRNSPQRIGVYAFENANVTVRSGNTLKATQSIAADTGFTFVINEGSGAYQVESDGFAIVYHYSNGVIDPKPVLPASLEFIGFPSSRGNSIGDSVEYPCAIEVYQGNDTREGDWCSAIRLGTINPDPKEAGQTSLYRCQPVVAKSNRIFSVNSYADANGGCAAPWVPTAVIKGQKRFATNTIVDYVAFASKEPGVVTMYDDTGAVVSTQNLTRSGSLTDSPCSTYFGAQGGIRYFESTVDCQGWYQPNTNTNAGNDDESILFGWE